VLRLVIDAQPFSSAPANRKNPDFYRDEEALDRIRYLVQPASPQNRAPVSETIQVRFMPGRCLSMEEIGDALYIFTFTLPGWRAGR